MAATTETILLAEKGPHTEADKIEKECKYLESKNISNKLVIWNLRF